MFASSAPSGFTREVTSDDQADFKRVFAECDQGSKGYLDKVDFKVAMVTLFGYKPSKLEVNAIFEKWGDPSSETGCLHIKQFTDAMSQKMSTVQEDEHIRQIFVAFDTQCRGFLTVDDLKKIFAQIAPNITMHRIEATFREADRDGDGRVSYKDFEFMMKFRAVDSL